MHILGGLRLIIAVHVEFTARSVAPHGLAHGKAAKLLVKRTLNALKPLAVHTDETEQLASHLTVRVNTLEFAGQLDARKVRLPGWPRPWRRPRGGQSRQSCAFFPAEV